MTNLLNRLYKSEVGQGMVEYLLILSLVVLVILAMFAALLHLFTTG